MQDRGYQHKGWSRSRDPDLAPSNEKMGHSHHLSDVTNIKTNFRIFRPVAISDFDTQSQDVQDFLYTINVAYAKQFPRRESPIRYDMSLSFFGDRAIRQAIQSSPSRAYRDFGTDMKQARDIATKLKGSFIDFLRDSRAVQISMQDPFIPYGAETDYFGGSSHRMISAGDNAYKWATAKVTVAPTPILLPGNYSKYFALDVDQNDFLVEEKEDIRNFFRTQHRIVIEDRPHEDDHGEVASDRLHLTVAKVAMDEWRWFAHNTPIAPRTLPLLPPDAKFYVSER